MQYYTCPGCGRPALGLFQGSIGSGTVQRVISQCSDCGLKQEWMDASDADRIIKRLGLQLGKLIQEFAPDGEEQ